MTWTERVQASECTVRDLAEVWSSATIEDDRKVSRSLHVALAINPEISIDDIRRLLPWFDESRHCIDVFLGHCLESSSAPNTREQLLERFPEWETQIDRAVEISRRVKVALDSHEPTKLMPGDRFDRYTIVRLIGHGSQGEVYEAFNSDHPDVRVAIKIFRHADTRLREQVGARMIDHHSVARVIDYGEFEGFEYIAYRFVDGVTLAKHAEGHTVGWREACMLVCGVGHGLAAIHGAGLVHRDIKPSNIIIDQSGQPVLVDLGISLDTATAENSGMEGSVCWMAPEQFNGAGSVPISDVYSLAGVLYWLLSGHRPNGKNATESRVALTRMDSPNLSHLPSQTPARLIGVLRRAMAPTPRDRTESASRFVDELQAVLDSKPITQVDSPKQVASLFLNRNRGRVAIAASLVTVILIGTTLWARSYLQMIEAQKIDRYETEITKIRSSNMRMLAHSRKAQEIMETMINGYVFAKDLPDTSSLLAVFSLNRVYAVDNSPLSTLDKDERYQLSVDQINHFVEEDSSLIMKFLAQEMCGLAAEICEKPLVAKGHYMAADMYLSKVVGWDDPIHEELDRMRFSIHTDGDDD